MRKHEHDYCAPCIYMLTVTTRDRQPLLGRLVSQGGEARIERSSVGELVVSHLFGIQNYYPCIRLLQFQVMPDHVHFILHVQGRLLVPLGHVIRGWKQGLNRAYQTLEASGAERSRNGLFGAGFNDQILRGPEQLAHMIAYIQDNPRRLAIKRRSASFFSVRRGVDLLPLVKAELIGNEALLRGPLVAVHCRSRWGATEVADYQHHCLLAAQQGATLVGAFISPAEREILSQALESGLRIIKVCESGFGDYYKPSGRYFDHCSRGLLLELSIYPYSAKRVQVSREQCMAMNALAESLAAQHPFAGFGSI